MTRVCLAGVVLLLFATRVSAQDARAIDRFERTIEQVRESYFESARGRSVTEQARVLYGAYVTFSVLGTDQPGPDTRLWQADGRFWLQGQLRGHQVYGRLRVRYQGYDESVSGASDGLTYPVGDRYWYRFDWRTEQRAEEGKDPEINFWVQAGRQYINWVSGLVLSDTLYAVRTAVESPRWQLQGFVGWTPDSFVDFDGTRPGFDSDTDRFFWGVSLEYQGIHGHRPYVYFLAQEDDNDTALPTGARFLYDSMYVAVGSTGQIRTGQWLYRVELIYESGDSISDVLGTIPQTIDDVSAYAGRVLIAYMPYGQRDIALRIEGEVLIGSGDDDRGHSAQTAGGNSPGTDDNSFNDFGYANTGLALAPELANLVSFRLAAVAQPFKGRGHLDRFSITIEGFLFTKLDSNGALSVGSTAGDSFVGWELDLLIDWVVVSDVAVEFRYGVFFPGDAVPGSERQFVFVGVSYGF